MENNNSNLIVRHRLMDLLDQVANKRVIYVCAPAGYGKTVCIRQWIARTKNQHAFISVDDYDNQMSSLCKKICDAFLTMYPKNEKLREIVSHSAFDSAADEFTISAVATLPSKKRASLVIDDLQYILDERVQRFIFVLMERLPPKYQIIFISRAPLPVGLYDILAREFLATVTEENFHFTENEIALLYEKHGRHITKKQSEGIYRFTAGWAIAVNALLLSGNKMLDSENMNHFEEYIRTRVWEHWDADTRDFMLKTAILHHLLPPLCDAVTGRSDSELILKRLVQQNAFVMQTQKGIFHYHHLFHSFLLHTLEAMDKDFKKPLLQAAGQWYLAQQDFYGAIDCFIECDSCDGVVACFGLLISKGQEYLHIEKFAPLTSLPIVQKSAEKFPYIYSALSWAAFNKGQAQDMAKYADLYYQYQLEIIRLDPRLIFHIILQRLVDFRATMSELLSVVMAMPTNPTVQTMSDVGASVGVINQNMPFLHRGTRDFSECAIGDPEDNVSKLRAVLGGVFGDQAELLAETMTAGLLYEQGHLDQAYAHALNAYVKIEKSFSSEAKFCAVMAFVRIQDALNETLEAESSLAQMAKIIEEDRAYYLNYNFTAFLMQRNLAKGDVNAARDWLREHETSIQSNLDFYRIYIHFTTCRAYILTGKYPEAIALLTKLLELVQTYRRPADIIECRILLSIALNKRKRGAQSEAIAHLEQAVALAHQFGFTQMFLNESAELADMLQWLQNRAAQSTGQTAEIPPVSFIRMLYLGAKAHIVASNASGTAPIASHYTDKQKEVMRLLCEGKNRQEIATIMNVKLSTVRSHIDLIYKKLDVSSAADAVSKIKASGVLNN